MLVLLDYFCYWIGCLCGQMYTTATKNNAWDFFELGLMNLCRIIPESTQNTTAVAFLTQLVYYPYLRRNNGVLHN